jgi:hypothetical protein
MVRKQLMAHLTMPIPDFYIGHLVTPRANDIYGKKTADGPPDNAQLVPLTRMLADQRPPSVTLKMCPILLYLLQKDI